MDKEIRARAGADLEGGVSDGDDQYDGESMYARTVLDRALNGRDMVASAATGSSYLAYEHYETGLCDALANLLHFARRYEIDFEDELERARRHHTAEARFDWDEVPE